MKSSDMYIFAIILQLFAERLFYNNSKIGPIRTVLVLVMIVQDCAYSTMDVVVISLDAIDNFSRTSRNI